MSDDSPAVKQIHSDAIASLEEHLDTFLFAPRHDDESAQSDRFISLSEVQHRLREITSRDRVEDDPTTDAQRIAWDMMALTRVAEEQVKVAKSLLYEIRSKAHTLDEELAKPQPMTLGDVTRRLRGMYRTTDEEVSSKIWDATKRLRPYLSAAGIARFLDSGITEPYEPNENRALHSVNVVSLDRGGYITNPEHEDGPVQGEPGDGKVFVKLRGLREDASADKVATSFADGERIKIDTGEKLPEKHVFRYLDRSERTGEQITFHFEQPADRTVPPLTVEASQMLMTRLDDILIWADPADVLSISSRVRLLQEGRFDLFEEELTKREALLKDRAQNDTTT